MRSQAARAAARSSSRTARKSATCRSAITLPEPDSRPFAPSTSELSSQALCVVRTFTGPRQALQGADVSLVQLRLAGLVLDRDDRGFPLDERDEVVKQRALPGRQAVLEVDDRQVSSSGDA